MPASVEMPICFIAVLAVLLWLARSFRRCSGRLPLPPGPPGLPFVGTVFDYPKVSPWLAFRDMGRKYGDVVSLRIMGQQLVILNDYKATVDLLGKRSSIYSSRPASPMSVLSGWDWVIPFIPYGLRWRRHRRVLWEYFHPGAIHKYHACQEESARGLLSKLLETPGDFTKHIEYALGLAVMGTCYGLPIAKQNDPYISVIKAAEATLELVTPGSHVIIETFPILARSPSWIPGMGILRSLEHAREVTTTMRELPWSHVKDAMAAGDTVKSSVASKILQRISDTTHRSSLESEETIGKNIAATVYFAGIDTAQSALLAFLVAMSLYPDVQAKAQTELSRVLGQARLPLIADMGSLPYTSAIVKETLRWHTTGPLGVPHAVIADDEYHGYFIPKDSVVIANTWAILHNPEIYPQPDQFIPERFLESNGPGALQPDPTVAFGYGRRVCPGRHYATPLLFVYMASILHTFNISAPLDEDGKPIQIQPRPTTGLVSFLEDCRCTLRPRSAWAEALIRRESTDAAMSN